MKKIALFVSIAFLFSACQSTAPVLSPTPTDTPSPMATFTPLPPTSTITPTPTITKIPSITPTPIHPVDTLLFHQADDIISYDWFSYLPGSIDPSQPSYIWVSGIHGNISTDDYTKITEESRSQAEWRTELASEHNYILLVPVIPRPNIKFDYAVSLPWYVFLPETAPFLQRPDEKVNLMIDKLLGDLRSDGYSVHDKVYMDGFSAGAMFTQRYALLHPERIQAIAAGQCGGAMTLPEVSYDNIPMNWPVGVNDYKKLVGYDFDREVYKKLPQFIYIGDIDVKNSTLYWGPYEDDYNEVWKTPSEIYFLKSTFGDTDPVRLQNQVVYLNNLGYTNITFKLYPGIGHQLTGEMLDDTFAFFSSHK